ncbi:cytochrome c [Erythrobacter sp.]|uniref:c-type cytochrome n=1 Tax=Erythrobacter sp. TaxID=1042 RepID=UPI001B16AAF7|nr:cytochrome c [Erythrobacter sp.]MBO6526680.1 cytochrome c [Erythrobacter sp.]MBO6531097.1 cytochrome c [Erythrobacter sp.]
MRNALALVGLAAVMTACSPYDDDLNSTQAALPLTQESVDLSAEEIVAARRVTYFLSTQAVGQIKAGIAEGGDLRRTQAGARMLARWAEVLPTMFPQGSNIDSSKALDTVWSDRDGFEEHAEAYRSAAVALAEQAKSGDREAANAAFMAMAGTCKACHDRYRAE